MPALTIILGGGKNFFKFLTSCSIILLEGNTMPDVWFGRRLPLQAPIQPRACFTFSPMLENLC